jgi:menaquinone-dependent protoporphyrinogen oxidase
MARKVLLLCSSTDGQTRRICERLRAQMQEAGDAVTLTMIEDARDASPAGFDLAVVGARIRYGHTDKRVVAWADRHAALLNAMPSAFFSVNVVARKPGKDRAETNPYVKAFLHRVRWRPRMLEVFAGKVDYPRYGPLDREIIRFIMWVTHGPTDPKAVVEFTDWSRVKVFGELLCAAAADGWSDQASRSNTNSRLLAGIS